MVTSDSPQDKIFSFCKECSQNVWQQQIVYNHRTEILWRLKQPKDMNSEFTEEETQMTNEHMKRCSIVKTCKLKPKMRHHFTPIRLEKIKSANTRCCQGCVKGGTQTLQVGV
uniref:Uncharacterized protein n=1 Tax=Mustela putorius furo TaxID=9669 RepID=M3Y3F0_MUSPF